MSKEKKTRKKRGPNKPKVPIAQTDRMVSLDFAYKQIAIFRKGLDAANKRVRELEEFVKDVANNYDCDKDAHRYNTRCRSCEAKKLLTK